MPDLDAVHLGLTKVGSFHQPIAIASRRGDDALYVAQQDGKVYALRGPDRRQVLDMSDRTRSSGEQGLLGLAIAPDGAHLYVDYTDRDGGDTHVDEYALADDGTVDAGSRRSVIEQDQPFPNHNGGSLVFGPDGDLYIGLGDGGSEGDPQRNGQKLDTWLSKILRIDPSATDGQPYGVPSDNPFVGRSGVKPEIWSYGVRNPWRFSFDSANGDLWIGDVGQDTTEEIDHVPATEGAGRGTNFGWSAYEGTHRFNDDQHAPDSWMPLYEYPHGDAGCSVTGGVVYHGRDVPTLDGAYVYSDYCAGGVNALAVAGGKVVEAKRLSDHPATVSSFGVDAAGEVYVLSLGGGVYRLTAD
jgi:glucose/arabinose dehydrogenase